MAAAEALWRGRFDNAFAFIGAGGHHAGRDFFGGYCCFNDVAIAMAHVRRLGGFRRYAILDTDAHHGDGTRDIVRDDPQVLHVCVCGTAFRSADDTKVDLPVHELWLEGKGPDAAYLAIVQREFLPRAAAFGPDLLVWYFGFDGHRGDYGDLGLTSRGFFGLADLLLDLARRLCRGRLLVVLGGGSRTDLATALIPPIIARLAAA